MFGGYIGRGAATEKEQAILESVKAAVEAHQDRSFSRFQAVKFATQVVAGVNYCMTVEADEEILYVKIAKPLPHTGQPPFLLAVESEPHSECRSF